MSTRGITFVTANIGRGGNSAKAIRAVKRVSRPAVIGWQEIDEADAPEEHALLNSLLSRWTHLGEHLTVPFSLSPSLEVLDRGVIKATPGIAKVGPTRHLHHVLVRERGRTDVDPVWVIDTHFMSKAFNGRIDYKESERKAAWHEHYQALRALVKELVATGYTVIWMGDVNRVGMPGVHPDEERLIAKGLDHIRIIQGSRPLVAVNTGRIDLVIDGHDAHWVRLVDAPTKKQKGSRK